VFRALKPYQLGFDLGLAVLCVGLRLPLGAPTAALVIVVVGMGGALALRRLSPLLALLVAWVFAIVQMASGLPPDVANLAILPVLYATARYGGAVVKWAGLSSAGLGALIASVYLTAGAYAGGMFGEPPTFTASSLAITFGAYLVAAAAALVLSWTLGLLAKTWSAARESRVLQVIAEHKVAVEQERNRIARDMHDVVAHSLAVVIAQSDGARYAMRADPDAADAALGTISSTAREALAEVRVLLGELRHDESSAPQPGLADLDRLFEQLRASGLRLEVERTGAAPALAASRQLAIYRIVQEALTNAMRHGDDRSGSRVRLAWRSETLEIVVANVPAVAAAPTSANVSETGMEGHGIAGMRERAALVGGTLRVRSTPAEFVVSASIPVRPEPGSET
jgi:signal transduction histidine kinase